MVIYCFSHNIIDYYQSRPDSLKHVSLASFAADYEYYKTMIHDKAQKSRQIKRPEAMDENLDEDNNNEEDDKRPEAMDDNLNEDDNNEEDDNILDTGIVLKN